MKLKMLLIALSLMLPLLLLAGCAGVATLPTASGSSAGVVTVPLPLPPQATAPLPASVGSEIDKVCDGVSLVSLAIDTASILVPIPATVTIDFADVKRITDPICLANPRPDSISADLLAELQAAEVRAEQDAVAANAAKAAVAPVKK